jgi:hypothetical protein
VDEIGQILETRIDRSLRYWGVGQSQCNGAGSQPRAQQVLVRAYTKRCLEGAQKVKLAHPSEPRKLGDTPVDLESVVHESSHFRYAAFVA